MIVATDPVDWRPFCGNTACPCMEPDVTRPCEEFVDADESGQRRCGRCGWPDYRHGIHVSGVRYGRAPSNLAKGEYVYYRQRPGKQLENWQHAGREWVLALYHTFDDRLRAENASPLEPCTAADMPDYVDFLEGDGVDDDR